MVGSVLARHADDRYAQAMADDAGNVPERHALFGRGSPHYWRAAPIVLVAKS
jgi:hypothetical protein